MIKRLYIFLMLACAAILLTEAVARSGELKESPIRVQVITGGHGFEQEAFHQLFDSMPDVSTSWATYPDAAELLKPELAERFDAIVFYDMWAQGITADQQQAFVGLLKKGIGVVALHHTLGSHQDWPEYETIIGGRYFMDPQTRGGKQIPRSTFKHGQDIPVQVKDAQHPITRGLKDFTIHDETYGGFETRSDAHVLLTTKHALSSPSLAWTGSYGASRVFTMQLGHDHFAYENPQYRTLVQRALRWVAGRPTDPAAPARKLFNGRDLTGWEPAGKAVWEVSDGILIGKQGAGNTPGDLLTTESFSDFELSVTYRIVWPANSGIWYRYQEPRKTFQADILEYKQPFALSGTLYRPGVPGEPFIAINTNADIIDRDGWNTMVIRAAGQHQVLFLNGTKTVDVYCDVTDHGKIGFQVHPGDQFGQMQIQVKEVTIRPL